MKVKGDMMENIVYRSFDGGKTKEKIGFERLSIDGNWEYLRFSVVQQKLRKDWTLGTITDNQGNAKFYRYPYIGIRDKEGEKIYADSSLVEYDEEDDSTRNKVTFSYYPEHLSFFIEHRGEEYPSSAEECVSCLKVVGSIL